MRYLLIFIFLILASPLYAADKYVVVNDDESIHTIAEKPDDVLTPTQERFVVSEEDCPDTEPPSYYTFDKDNEVFVRKSQQVIDDAIADVDSKAALMDEVESYIWDEAVDAVKIGKTQAEQDFLDSTKSTRKAGSKSK